MNTKYAKIKAKVEDPDALLNDKSTAEVVLEFFREETDKYRENSNNFRVVWMKKDRTITGYPTPMGIMSFHGWPGGSAPIDKVFEGVLKIEPTDKFRTYRTVLLNEPYYKLQRVFRVTVKENSIL